MWRKKDIENKINKRMKMKELEQCRSKMWQKKNVRRRGGKKQKAEECKERVNESGGK